MSDVKGAIREKALALGFDAVGFTRAETTDLHQKSLQDFVDMGLYGTMQWMADRVHHRLAPKNLWPEARTAIVLGMNYGPDSDPMALLAHTDRAGISVYARGKDYHDIVKKRLKALGRWIAETYGSDLKVFVDTAPVPEKTLAEQAAIGWQGKHSNIVSNDFGSWLFLGVIYLDAALDPDTKHTNQCGSCTSCLTACPTDAFIAPYKLDARKCISYLTIEHKGMIDPVHMEVMGNRIYGCDDCLAVCPWNKFARLSAEAAFYARIELQAPLIRDLLALDDTTFRQIFSGSPVKRIGRERFIRNVCIAAGNSSDHKHIEPLRALLNDPSEVIKGTARWALDKLGRGEG